MGDSTPVNPPVRYNSCPAYVWYLAYGSNVNPARFRKYLEGGLTEPGARDPSPPTGDRWFSLLFRLDFGLESQRWSGGGVAFVHPDQSHRTWFRAWRITGEQFEDVFAQENRRPVGTPLPWAELHQGPEPHLDVGDRWYRRIHNLWEVDHAQDLDGEPAFTFSAAAPLPHNPPHDDYRTTIASGLADNPSLDPHTIDEYLDAASLGR